MAKEADPSAAEWSRIRAAVEAALEQPAAARDQFITSTFGTNTRLADETRRLVRACEAAGLEGDFLAGPFHGLAAEALADHTMTTLQRGLPEHYTLEQEIGHGGAAVVYRAFDSRHERAVAIKFLLPGVSAFLHNDRFVREIRLTAQLTHPHILPLHDSGAAGDLLYYVMPYIGGETLRGRLTRQGALEPAEVLRLLHEILGALDYAHRRGVIHRDIKPENILLLEGHAVLADFGIARAISRSLRSDGEAGDTAHSTVFGTPAYMAPEQEVAAALDQRVDLYATGVVAYEMLIGSRPAAGAAHADALLRAGAPAALASLIERLLAPDPAGRPQSAELALRELQAIAAGGVSLSTAQAALHSHAGLRSGRGRVKKVSTTLIALAGILAVIAAAWFATRPAESTSPGADLSLAVLPFVNTTGDPAADHLGDGLTDELIVALGRLEGVRIAGRTSVFALRGRALDPRAIADALGVGMLLEGTVRRTDERIRVTAQLIDGATGDVRWSDDYDRAITDIIAVQEEIAAAIAQALRLRLGVAGPSRRGVRNAADMAAYESYLKGRYVLRTRLGRESIHQAAQYFEQAIAHDSTYAQAWAGLSDTQAYIAIFGHGPSHEHFTRAKDAARRALALDSTLAEAHAALGHALFVYDFDRPAGERSLRRALELDPTYTVARQTFAILLQGQGRFDEAIAQLDTARMNDPLAPAIRAVLGRVYVSAEQPDRAIDVLLEALELAPQLDVAYQQLGFAYLQKGMDDEAIDALRRAAALSGARDSAQLAYVYAATGQPDEAERIVQRLLTVPDHRSRLPFHLAMAYAGLGNTDEAFRWLDIGYEERSSFMDAVRVTHAFRPLHDDPRWHSLMAKMRFEP